MKFPGLSEKGKYATLLGIVIIILDIVYCAYLVLSDKILKYGIVALVAAVIGIVLIILPSKIIASYGDKFKIEMED